MPALTALSRGLTLLWEAAEAAAKAVTAAETAAEAGGAVVVVAVVVTVVVAVVVAIVVAVVVIIVVIVIVIVVVVVIEVAEPEVATEVVVVVIAIAIAIALANGKVVAIVLSSSLGNLHNQCHPKVNRRIRTHRHQNRLMVTGRRHGADAVESGWQTTVHLSRQSAVPIARIIDTLEEGKFSGIRRILRVCRAHVLDRDVDMSLNDAIFIQLLRRGVIRNVRVGEEPGLQVVNLELNGERLIGVEIFIVLGAQEHG